MKHIKYIVTVVVALMLFSCNYLELEPVGQVIPHKVSEYRALLTAGYVKYPNMNSVSKTCLLSDEVGKLDLSAFWSATDGEAVSNNYRWDYGRQMNEYPWQDFYKSIFQANAVIDGIVDADDDKSEPREQILAEAYALRAYCHFQLANLYGKWYDPATASADKTVPVSTYIDIEQKYTPSTNEKMFEQILSDINTARTNMVVEAYPDSKTIYRFSKKVLNAFEARVRLYMGEWERAFALASALIPESPLQDMNEITDKKDVKLPWKPTSKETILALDSPFGGVNGDLKNAALLSDGIIAKFNQSGDNRWRFTEERWDWTTFEFLGVQVVRDYSTRASIRSAEIYLIAAEAAAHLSGKTDEARQYLNTLQKSRFKPAAATTKAAAVNKMTADELLTEIADERAREFLLEGHRWMDLRRTSRPKIEKTFEKEQYTLQQNDKRYILPFPWSALENNPELAN